MTDEQAKIISDGYAAMSADFRLLYDKVESLTVFLIVVSVGTWVAIASLLIRSRS